MSAFSDLVRSGFFRRVVAMIRKEFVQLRRDRITFATIITIPLMQLVLFGYTWALLHHMLGGIRHLIWDTIHGFEPAERELLTLATLIGSITLTLILWVVGYLVMGGPR